jgi:c-di-GMP-binding flagellar brake protein YcgR
MYIVLAIVGIILTLFLFYLIGAIFSKDIEFVTLGLDAGFKISEIFLLRKLAFTSKLEHPLSLFWSVSALSRSTKKALEDARKSRKANSDEFQQFLSKLYKYRTKIELDSSNKKIINSTQNLGQGQRIRILVKGEGAFSSQLINNARELVVSLPKRQGRSISTGVNWKDRRVSVYLWRKNDASYTFDTLVLSEGFFHDSPVLYLQHTDRVIRTQKRKSVRALAALYGEAFISTGLATEQKQLSGLKCFLEDISADGALIRVGGKAAKGLQVLLKFLLDNREIIMEGLVRGVEYNADVNQSRLHFECEKIDTESKNVILSYVYNVLPQADREELEAIELAKNDAIHDADSEETQNENVNPQPELTQTEQ